MDCACAASRSGTGIPFGASHRVNFDTPPLKGLRLEPFGSIGNHCKESMRCALSRFHPEPVFLARNRRKG
jgi:hypothetical protein